MKFVTLISALIFTLLLMASAQALFGQTTYAPFPQGVLLQLSYNSGAPVANGFVCLTASGTTTNLASYQTPSGTLNTNPVTLDSGGRANIYLTAAAYTIKLYAPGTGNTCNSVTVGALIKSVDNVTGGSGSVVGSGTTNLLPKFSGTTTLANSTFFDDGTSSSLGLLAATDDPLRVRFQIGKNQNETVAAMVTNTNAGTLAQSMFTARSGTGSLDISIGVTSDGFTPAGGINHSAGKIYTGTGATAGLAIQTGAGNIYFQPNGSTIAADISPTQLTARQGFTTIGTTTFNGLAYTWPASQAAGTYLTTNGSGALTWSAVGGGGGGLSGSGTSGTIVMWTAGTAAGNSILTQVSSNRITQTGTAPAHLFSESDQGTDLKKWAMGPEAGIYYFSTRDDTDAAGVNIFTVTRGLTTAVSQMNFGVPVSVTINSNASNDVVSVNTTVGTAARAVFKATSDTGSIYMGVTSSGYTFAGSADANQGFIATTDAGTTNGIVFKSVAGPMLFRPAHGTVAAVTNALITLTADYAMEFTDTSTAAISDSVAHTFRIRNVAGAMQVSQNGGAYAAISTGTGVSCTSCTANLLAKSNGTNLANSTFFDDGTSASIGTLAVTDDPTRIRFQIEKDQNESTSMLVRNDTSGTLGRAAITARSKGASGTSDDITMMVTSNLYTPVGGISANAGAIYTGASATAGLTLQTAAGSIYFQPAGTTVRGEFNAAGLTVTGIVTATSFTGAATGLTALNANNLVNVAAVANGGTGVSSFTSTRLPFYNGSSLTSSRLSDNGTDLDLTSGSLNVNTSGQGIRFASTGGGVGSGIWGNSSGINISIGGTDYAAFDNTSSATQSNLYIYINGTRRQVAYGTCTVAGGSHSCLYVN